MNTTQDDRKVLLQLFIFMDIEPFSYYFVTTKTLTLSHMKNK